MAETGFTPRENEALYLMGGLGLVQCRDVIQQKDYVRRPGGGYGTLSSLKSEKAGARPDDPLKLGNNVQIITGTMATADLKRYPPIGDALQDLRNSTTRDEVRIAENKILDWYDYMEQSMIIILERSHASIYSNDTKCLAAYITGEYPFWRADLLPLNINLRDTNGITADLGGRLKVINSDPQYPCAEGMIKVGRRLVFQNVITYAERLSPDPSAKRRIIDTLIAIDEVKLAEDCRHEIEYLQNPLPNIPDDERAQRILFLKVILNLPHH